MKKRGVYWWLLICFFKSVRVLKKIESPAMFPLTSFIMFSSTSIVVLLLLISFTQAAILPDSTLGLTEIAWSFEPAQIYLGSPSILRLSNGDILASADRFGIGFQTRRNASIYLSTDDGATWTFQSWVLDQYWSNLFQLNVTSNDVYLLGTATDGPAPLKISKSTDQGKSWKQTTTIHGGIKSNQSYETGPTPALIHNGVVYRAVERLAPPFRWGTDYQAVVMYANVSSNLLDADSWTISKSLPFNLSWIPTDWSPQPQTPGYLEGNMVVGPDGGIVNVLRFNTRPYSGNKAIILRFDSASNQFQFDSIVTLPGGHTKFVIRQDSKTGMYVTLSNPNTIPNATDQRNILALCTSTDLRTWKERKVLLNDDTGFSLNMLDSVKYTGFHYVDWQFDGKEDIIMAVRTAYRGAVSYHNSNRLTYKKILNWRSLRRDAVVEKEL